MKHLKHFFWCALSLALAYFGVVDGNVGAGNLFIALELLSGASAALLCGMALTPEGADIVHRAFEGTPRYLRWFVRAFEWPVLAWYGWFWVLGLSLLTVFLIAVARELAGKEIAGRNRKFTQ